MTGRRAMTFVIVLAALSAAAIIAMLPAEGSTIDSLLFALAALPLGAGAWFYLTRRQG